MEYWNEEIKNYKYWIDEINLGQTLSNKNNDKNTEQRNGWSKHQTHTNLTTFCYVTEYNLIFQHLNKIKWNYHKLANLLKIN